MICLVISVNKKQKITILEPVLGKEVVIGREEDCDISLPQATGVSRHHCRLCFAEDAVYISDMGSTNGLYADGIKIEDKSPMKEGVKYTLGDAEMQITGLKQYSIKSKQDNNDSVEEEAPKTEPPSVQKVAFPHDIPVDDTETEISLEELEKEKKNDEGNEGHDAKRSIKQIAEDVNKPKISITETLLVIVGSFIAGFFLYCTLTYGNPLTPFQQPQPPAPLATPPTAEEAPALTEEEESSDTESAPAEEADDTPEDEND